MCAGLTIKHGELLDCLKAQISNAMVYKDMNEATTPYRKIDAVVALLCAMKVAEEYAVVEDRSTVRYVPL